MADDSEETPGSAVANSWEGRDCLADARTGLEDARIGSVQVVQCGKRVRRRGHQEILNAVGGRIGNGHPPIPIGWDHELGGPVRVEHDRITDENVEEDLARAKLKGINRMRDRALRNVSS